MPTLEILEPVSDELRQRLQNGEVLMARVTSNGMHYRSSTLAVSLIYYP